MSTPVAENGDFVAEATVAEIGNKVARNGNKVAVSGNRCGQAFRAGFSIASYINFYLRLVYLRLV